MIWDALYLFVIFLLEMMLRRETRKEMTTLIILKSTVNKPYILFKSGLGGGLLEVRLDTLNSFVLSRMDTLFIIFSLFIYK